MPSLSLEPSQQSASRPKKQPSRKGKKAWRKNIDVEEIEAGIEKNRQDVVLGGTILSKRPTQDLFVVDVKGDKRLRLSFHGRTSIKKPSKSREILARRSAVPALSTRKRAAAQSFRGPISASRLRALSKIAYTGALGPSHEVGKADIHDREPDELKDIWSTDSDPMAPTEPDLRPIPEIGKIKTPATLRKPPVSLTSSGKPIKAVTKPDAGKSYVPLFTEWERLVSEEGQRAVESERVRLQKLREMSEMRARVEKLREDIEEREKEEEEAGINNTGSESQSEGETGAAHQQPPGPGINKAKKTPKIKDRAKRNRIRRMKEEARVRAHEKQIRAKHAQLDRLEGIKREVQEAEEKRRQSKAKTGLELVKTTNLGLEPGSRPMDDEPPEADARISVRPRLGKRFAPPSPTLEIQLPDELCESLRTIRPVGNLLRDRFRNHAIQGKFEARTRPNPRRVTKTESTVKWTYKDWDLL